MPGHLRRACGVEGGMGPTVAVPGTVTGPGRGTGTGTACTGLAVGTWTAPVTDAAEENFEMETFLVT